MIASAEPHYGPWTCFDCKKIIEVGEPHAYSATSREYPGVGPNGLIEEFHGHQYFCAKCDKARNPKDWEDNDYGI